LSDITSLAQKFVWGNADFSHTSKKKSIHASLCVIFYPHSIQKRSTFPQVITRPKIVRMLIVSASITLFVVTYVGYHHITQLVEASNLVDRSNEIRQELERTYSQLREADSELQGFIITGDSSCYHEFWKARQSIRASSSRLYSAMEKSSGQYQRLRELESLINYRHEVMVRVLKQASSEVEQKSNTAEIRKYTALIRAKINSLQDEEEALLAKRVIIKNKRESFTPLLIFIMAVFSLAIMLFAYYKISRELIIRTWMQGELEAKNNALTNANKELEQFVFGSSHDLQEPLRKIETFCSLINHKHLLENNIEGTRLINNIQVSAKRMRDMLNNLLGYARFYSATDKKVSLSLNDVVEDVLHDYQPFIEEKGAIVQVDPLPKIKGAKSQLYRLFQNLISNALKF
jgi:signal transduction histidine kinase